MIVSLTVLSLAISLTSDLMEHHTAGLYLQDLYALRDAALKDDQATVKDLHEKLRRDWDQDAVWLNCIINHHYTRAVQEQMLALHTAIQQGWQEEVLKVVDRLEAAFIDIESADFCRWENFL